MRSGNTRNQRATRVGLRAAGALVASFVIGSAAPAEAALSPALASRLSLDTAYVTGLSSPTDIAFSADGRAVVTTKNGSVVVRRANGSLNVVAYPFPPTLDTGSEKGLLGVVADPNVAQNHTFYFYVSNGPVTDTHRVYKAVLTASDAFSVDPNPVVGASRGVGPGLEGPQNHDGGGMVIHNGQLYLGVGDTGFNATPPVNKYGSCLDKGNGKILRVNLDGSIAAGNPLVGVASVTACASELAPWATAAPDPRIYAWGLRNPWRFWIDPLTNLMWIGDVGEATAEEISVGSGNQHYGYPFVEGGVAWGDVEGKNCTSLSPSRPCTGPVHSYPRSVGQSVTGGLIPTACGWKTALGGTYYVFGDFVASWIKALPVNAAHTGLTSTTPIDVGTFANQQPVSFRMGPDGALYVVMFAGSVYRIAPSLRAGEGCPPAVPALPTRKGVLLFSLLFALGAAALLVAERRARRA